MSSTVSLAEIPFLLLSRDDDGDEDDDDAPDLSDGLLLLRDFLSALVCENLLGSALSPGFSVKSGLLLSAAGESNSALLEPF